MKNFAKKLKIACNASWRGTCECVWLWQWRMNYKGNSLNFFPSILFFHVATLIRFGLFFNGVVSQVQVGASSRLGDRLMVNFLYCAVSVLISSSWTEDIKRQSSTSFKSYSCNLFSVVKVLSIFIFWIIILFSIEASNALTMLSKIFTHSTSTAYRQSTRTFAALPKPYTSPDIECTDVSIEFFCSIMPAF